MTRERVRVWVNATPQRSRFTHGHYHNAEDPGRIILALRLRLSELILCTKETTMYVVVRSEQEPVLVNLDIQPMKKPESVGWIGSIHRRT